MKLNEVPILRGGRRMKLLCLFGIHKWDYDNSGEFPLRKCKNCKRTEIGSYDMSYGETIWDYFEDGVIYK